MSEMFPFHTADDLINYIDAYNAVKADSESKGRGMAAEVPPSYKSADVVMLQPDMPDIASEDILSLAQAIVLVIVSFIPGVTETQQIALYGLSAALAAVISGSGAVRRKARNKRVAIENQLLVTSQMRR